MSTRKLLVSLALSLAFGSAAAVAETPGLGKPINEADITAWNIEALPDGTGLPVGSGTPTQGAAIYSQKCAICHGDSMEGKVGPALAGEQFLSVSQFQELTAGFLYRTMSKQMPKNAPGSLSKTEYLDVLAYILKVNGYPAGPKQLTADNSELNKIKIVPTGKLSEHSETEDRQ